MDWKNVLFDENEKPLEKLVSGYSHTSVFRTMAFIGDSLCAGEFERVKEDGSIEYYDMHEYSWGAVYCQSKRNRCSYFCLKRYGGKGLYRMVCRKRRLVE